MESVRPAPTRRQVLAGAAGLALGAGLASDGGAGVIRAHRPHVLVVGAGLAGLACAELLHRHGVRVSVYEANADRLGGRCWSSRGWRDGQVAEHGGEFIDSRHTRMRHLAHRFGLVVDDLYASDAGGNGRLWLDGDLRQGRAYADEMDVFDRRIRQLSKRIGPYTWPEATSAAREVDEMTARDLVDEYLPGGSRGLPGQRYQARMASFLGLDLDRLGGLAVVDNVDLPPGADERYHVRGGNDQIVAALAAELRCVPVTTAAPLRALRRRRNGTYALRFGDGCAEVAAHRVVLCLPFTALRRVDLTDSGLSPHKRRCIDELGMGTNAKLILQVAHRPQRYNNWNGLLTTDAPGFGTWESSAAQPGRRGLLTVYYGGRSGARGLPGGAAHRPAPEQLLTRTLRALDRNGRMRLREIADDCLGRAVLDHWTRDPWVRGSYAAFLPGQYTRYAGFVGRPERGVHFAGEHTSPLANQGYLEGAVRTGERAAHEVLRAVGRQ